MITATKNEAGDWFIEGERFDEIIAGIYAGNPADTGAWGEVGVAVVGRLPDKRMVVLGEALGPMGSVIQELINLKDTLKFEDIIHDPGQEELRNRCMATDGLSDYLPLGEESRGRIRWLHQASHWPYFHSRETKAYLIPTRPLVLVEYDQISQRIQEWLTKNPPILRVSSWCEMLTTMPSLGPKGRYHPWFKALVFAAVHCFVEPTEEATNREINTSIWYTNRR